MESLKQILKEIVHGAPNKGGPRKKPGKVKFAKSTDVPSFSYVKKLNAVNGGKVSTTPEQIAEFWKGASRFLVVEVLGSRSIPTTPFLYHF